MSLFYLHRENAPCGFKPHGAYETLLSDSKKNKIRCLRLRYY